MATLLPILLLAALGTSLAQNSPRLSAEEVMERVAANQDLAQKLRSEYLYQQHIRIVSRRTNGKLAREETADYLMIPTPEGTKKELKSIVGRYWHKGRYIDFQGEPVPNRDSLDADLIHDLRKDLTGHKSKDSLGRDLFPLTAGEQKQYRFESAGEDTIHGRKVYRIKFRPRDKNNFTWAGEALIDKAEFQPLSVYTRLARKIPLFVRTVLGTNLPGLGFNVEYRRFDEGVWFPVSFGTEFRLHAVFFINRDITVSLENSGFQRTNVKSKVLEYKPLQ